MTAMKTKLYNIDTLMLKISNEYINKLHHDFGYNEHLNDSYYTYLDNNEDQILIDENDFQFGD